MILRAFFILVYMAQQTIQQMVLRHLPFLLASDTTVQTTIDNYTNDAYYIFQGPLGVADIDVETPGTYTGVTRIMIAYYVAYDMIRRKVIENLAGNPNTGVSVGAGARRVLKGKADVVEGEFTYVKASDGSAILVDTKYLMDQFKEKICELAAELQITLAMCNCTAPDVIPPFIIQTDCD